MSVGRAVDTTATRIIPARPERVADIMFNPLRDPEWIGGAKLVDPPSGNPTRIGTRVTRHGGFLGRKFSWTTEVVDHQPDHLLKMRFVAGPMKGGDVTYLVESQDGGSRVSIRNTGPGPQLMAWFVKRSVSKDLDRLAAIVTRS